MTPPGPRLRMAGVRSALAPRRPSLVLAAVLAVAAFGIVSLAFSGATLRRDQASPRAGLISLVEARQRDLNDLGKAVQSLRDQLDHAELAARGTTAAERQQAEIAAHLSIAAGTTAVQGPAVVVRLADSGRRPGDPGQSSAYRIHDTDLQLVVNALFAAGAEAVAVNHQRVVATTAIRAAGDTIVVNFRPLTPPYEVDAVGASRSRFSSSEVAGRFRHWVELFGLGFTVRSESRVTVPAYVGRVVISTATPAP